MSVTQILDYYADFYADFNRDAAQEMIHHLGIDLKQRIRQMSKGTREKVQLIMVMSRQAKLYLLDEPENSLSPQRQQELAEFLENQARFFGCQFIIATHSPFLLSMRGALVYDMDADPVRPRRWTQLPAVRAYYDFFQKYADAFED